MNTTTFNNVRETYAQAAATIQNHLEHISDKELRFNLNHAANQCSLLADEAYLPIAQAPIILFDENKKAIEPPIENNPYDFLEGHFSRSKGMIDIGKTVLPIIKNLLNNEMTITHTEGRVISLHQTHNTNKTFAMKTR